MPATSDAEAFYERVSAAPGESPFRVRGTSYVFHQQYVRERLPGGIQAQGDALSSLREHPFFSTLFLAGGWYDVFPLIAMGHACASVAGVSFDEFVRTRAKDQVDKDLRFVRRLLVQLANPDRVASRLPGVAISYFDFLTLDTVQRSPGRTATRMHGIPVLMVPWFRIVTSAFVQHVMTVNGAKDVRTEIREAKREPDSAGFEMTSVDFAIHWT